MTQTPRVGWQTLRFLYEQITGDPDGVCSIVADVRAARGGGTPVPFLRTPGVSPRRAA